MQNTIQPEHTEEHLPEKVVSIDSLRRPIEHREEVLTFEPPVKEEVLKFEPPPPEAPKEVIVAPPPVVTEPPIPAVVAWSARDHGPAPTDPALIGSTWPPPDPRQLATRRLDQSDNQFPPRRSEELCAARGASGGSYDANKQVLDLIDVQPDNTDG